MAGSNETYKGGGWKASSVLLANGVQIFTGTAAPTDGTSGTGVKVAGPGSIYVNTANGDNYQNVGTKASPLWKRQAMLYSSVALTSAQIKALNSTPVAVLPAPGAGKYIVVHRAAVAFVGTATQYTSGGVVSLVDSGGHNAVHTGGVPATTIQSASSSLTDLDGLAGANGNARPANTGIDVECATANFATGTGTARIQVWYSIIALTD